MPNYPGYQIKKKTTSSVRLDFSPQKISEELSNKLLKQLTLSDLEIALSERSLGDYTRNVWPILEPSTPLIWGWHIDCIAEHLEAVTLGQIKRLIINVPPRNMKSLLTVVMWPTWEWGPKALSHLRYLFNSYSAELSTKHSMDRRTVIESDWYQKAWGDKFKLVEDNNRKTEFANDKRGVMQTTSTGAAATGKGGNRLVIDDPLNPKQALSDLEREAANTHVSQTLFSRLNDKTKDPVVMIMQRLHQNDPTGYLLKEKAEMGWTHLELPAEAPKKTIVVFPLSKREVVREEGDVLWPEREPQSVLDDMKVALGAYAYAGQYSQRPSPLDGGLVKREWWRRYAHRPVSFNHMIMSVDAAFKDSDTSSFVAIHVWGLLGVDKYLVDRVHQRMSFTATISHIRTLRARWPEIDGYLIEDKANGSAIMDTLKNTISGLIPVEPEGSKIARAMAVSPQIQAGNVFLPEGKDGDEVIEEWSFMPNCEDWDDIDATSQALRYFKKMEGLNTEDLMQMADLIPEMQSVSGSYGYAY